MGGEEFLFILLLLGFLCLWFFKLANVLSLGKLYRELVSWITFIAGVVVWGIGFILSIFMAVEFMYANVVFRFVNVFLVIFVFLQLIEVFFVLASKPAEAESSSRSRNTAFR